MDTVEVTVDQYTVEADDSYHPVTLTMPRYTVETDQNRVRINATVDVYTVSIYTEPVIGAIGNEPIYAVAMCGSVMVYYYIEGA